MPTQPQNRRAGPSLDDSPELLEARRLLEYGGFVLRAVLRHKRIALVAFLGTLALGVTARLTFPIRWEVRGTILAQRSAVMGALSNPGMNRDWDAPTRAAREMLIRRDNLIALCKETKLVERYLAERAPVVRARDWLVATLSRRERDAEQLLDSLVFTLEERLAVQVGPEGTLTIGFTWTDPELALEMVQQAIQSFMESRYAAEIKMVGETIAILEGHDARVQRDIAKAVAALEEKARALRIRTGPRLAPEVRAPGPQDEELARIESTLAARRRALSDLEEFRRQRLSELQVQYSQQATVYAPQHPTLQNARRAIESASVPSPQIESLRLEVSDLEKQVKTRGGRGDGATAAAASVRGDLAQVARMRLEAEDPRLEYERSQLELLVRHHSNLLERIDAAKIEMDTAAAAFKYRYSILTPPQLPRGPAKPYTLIFVGGGLLGGIGLALLLCAAADFRSGIIHERWQVEQQLGLPVLTDVRK